MKEIFLKGRPVGEKETPIWLKGKPSAQKPKATRVIPFPGKKKGGCP